MRLILSPPGGAADARSVQEFIGFGRERGDRLWRAARGGARGEAGLGILPVGESGATMLLCVRRAIRERGRTRRGAVDRSGVRLWGRAGSSWRRR